MTSHLDEVKGINETIHDLRKLYMDRIKFESPILEMLIIDYYICTFLIDDVAFCLDCDYGIVTISVDNEAGNPFIFEIVNFFNRTDNLVEGK